MRDFPRDVHKLTVQFTINCSNSAEHPADIVISDDHESKIAFSMFRIRDQWRLSPHLHVISNRSRPELSVKGKTYPILDITAIVQRRPSYYIMNIWLPSFFFVIISWLSFQIPNEKGDVAARLQVSGAVLIAAMSHKMFMAQVLPPIAYTTWLDAYCRDCLIFIFIISLENGFGWFWSPEIDFWISIAILIAFTCLSAHFLWRFYHAQRKIDDQRVQMHRQATELRRRPTTASPSRRTACAKGYTFLASVLL